VSEPLVIFGVGGHGREMLGLVDAINAAGARWEVLGFLDDDPARHGRQVHGLPVLGGRGWLAERPGTAVALGIGSSARRARAASALGALGASFPALVHPDAAVGRRVVLAPGVVVAVRCVVTTDVTLGEHTHLNVAASVSHDCVVGRWVTLAPGVRVAGAVTLGDGCDVGVAAAAIPGVSLGEWCVVGAGAVVTRSLPPNVTAVGVPARVVKTREPGWHERA
jgi:sugar O-acyltransferase (sialic acid O-acetyltransferase NeuD family)